jgi:TolB-like protein/Tfp pilus assembly protein PilF
VPARASQRGWAVTGTAAAAALVIVAIGWWLWSAATFFSGAGKPADQATASAPPMPTAPAAASISQPLVAPRLSIVVLPFTNLSNDPDQQYFADGITEDLTTDLSRISDMFVISRNTAFTYRNKPIDVKQIGRDLGVRYLLEGSVQRWGNRLRVTSQLIDAETDAHLWAERFDRDTGDLFALQNEITSRLANTLGIELVAAEAARTTERPDALDYLLRGRAAQSKPASRENFAEQISLFEHALALDPQSFEGQSRLAIALAGRVLNGVTDSAAADLARAEGLVGQALAASPRYAYAHHTKATVLRALNRCEEAIPEYETALALNRNMAYALIGLGWCKVYAGSLDEAIPLVEQAIRLSPREPGIGLWDFQIGTVRLLQSRTDEAIVWLEKARTAIPAVPAHHSRLASAYALRGEIERATAELAEARRLAGDDRFSSIARLRASGCCGSPKTRDLFEATYFVGLREVGVPEE